MEVKSGNIAPGVLFRSKSPLYGGDEKKTIASLAIKAGIKCIINLTDNNYSIHALSKEVPWYHELVLQGNVICLHMTFLIPGVRSNEKKLRAALQFLSLHEGPYLIHCFAGVDRTGFVIALLEALMGADLKGICKNYLAAYFFDDSASSRIHKNGKLKGFMNQIKTMCRGANLTKIDIQKAAEE